MIIESMYTGVIRILKIMMQGVITKIRNKELSNRKKIPPLPPVLTNQRVELISSSPSNSSRP